MTDRRQNRRSPVQERHCRRGIGLRVDHVAADVAQEDERRLWDTEFLKKRQAAPAAPASPGAPTPPRPAPVYRRATPNPPAPVPAAGEMVGVTVWRLRPPRPSDGRDARLLLQEDDRTSNTEWTPERVETGTTFSVDEPVRLSIESPRAGFLYVIDREQYADGSTSDPYLIFPTQRIRGGNNAVSPGRVIELPDRSAFRLRPQRAGYRGELLTLLITAEAMPELSAGSTARQLDRALVERWERQWATPVERFEMVNGAGKPYTKSEREAAEGRLLTQADDLPQTLIRVAATASNPLIVTLPLRVVD